MVRHLPVTFIVVLVLAVAPDVTYGQTCSCAGAPLISSQSVSATSQGNLLFGVTFEHNEISTVYSGNQRVDNRSIERSTQSTLLELNYGITDRLTFSATITFIRKQRLGIQSDDELATTGIGDGLFLLKYVLHKNTIREQYQLAVGAGTKVPFGRSDLKQNGIALNLDMQPGTGAWDGVFWSYFSKTFAPASTVNFFLYNTFRLTGSTERFNENDRYRFGNEWVVNAGITDTIIPKLSYIGMINYRSTSSDQRNGNTQPNTGGKWINFVPALQYQLTPGLSAKLSGRIPVYRHLNGLQESTSFAASISLFYNFGKNVIF